MNKFVLVFLSMMTLLLTSANAAAYKGQMVFMKKCLTCHKDGESLVTKYKASHWKELMNEDGKPLAQLHLKSKKAKKSWKYFNGKRYLKKSKDLKDFLVTYAKDSGNVPVF